VRKTLCIALCLIGLAPAQAIEPPAAARAEIEHLLIYLEHSHCEFYRNGSWYDAAAARTHLDKKYAYLLDKGLVTRTEDFIARAGTQSSVSSKPYLVRCAGAAPVKSAQWFADELRRYRENWRGAPK